jgi:pimeloyl-ACP methyl ester carboxylesterase
MTTESTPQLRIGSGERVLLLHPFMLSHHVWHPVIDQLAPGHDVLAVTMPGHWGGPKIKPRRPLTIFDLADGVEAMLDEAGWDTCHIVGNSLGGWVSFELERRGRAQSITAIAPAGGWERFSFDHFSIGMFFLSLYPVAGLGRVLSPAAKVPFIRQQVLRFLSAQPNTVTDEAFANTIAAATHCDAILPVILGGLQGFGIQGLADVKAPTQLLLASDDRVIPMGRYGRKFLYELPDTANKVVLAQVGHVPMLENPSLIARMIAQHVAANKTRVSA